MLGPMYTRLTTHWALGTCCLTDTHLVFVGNATSENSAFSIPLENVVAATMYSVYECDFEPHAFAVVVKGTARPVFQALDAHAQSEWVYEINEVLAAAQTGFAFPKSKIRFPPVAASAPPTLPLQSRVFRHMLRSSDESSGTIVTTGTAAPPEHRPSPTGS